MEIASKYFDGEEMLNEYIKILKKEIQSSNDIGLAKHRLRLHSQYLSENFKKTLEKDYWSYFDTFAQTLVELDLIESTDALLNTPSDESNPIPYLFEEINEVWGALSDQYVDEGPIEEIYFPHATFNSIRNVLHKQINNDLYANLAEGYLTNIEITFLRALPDLVKCLAIRKIDKFVPEPDLKSQLIDVETGIKLKPDKSVKYEVYEHYLSISDGDREKSHQLLIKWFKERGLSIDEYQINSDWAVFNEAYKTSLNRQYKRDAK